MSAGARDVRALFLLLCPLVLYGTGAWAEGTSADEAYTEASRAFGRGDYASALRLWTPLAERGDPRAQFGLGVIYESGPGGTPTDQEEALRWYRLAARQGIPQAQNNLAIMYAEGRVVSRDLALAVTLWRQAAEAGYGPAQRNLAVALEGGVGVERNPREAALWYQRAEDRGLTS